MQGDHEPPLMQTNLPQWKGKISYEMKFIVPKELTDGSYRIVVGLYNKEGRLKLKAGKGVAEEKEFRYRVGMLVVDSRSLAAPPDNQGKRTLDLTGYELVSTRGLKNLWMSYLGDRERDRLPTRLGMLILVTPLLLIQHPICH